jgi:hypothetical protein
MQVVPAAPRKNPTILGMATMGLRAPASSPCMAMAPHGRRTSQENVGAAPKAGGTIATGTVAEGSQTAKHTRSSPIVCCDS